MARQRRLRNVGCEDALKKIELLHRHGNKKGNGLSFFLSLSLPCARAPPRNESNHRQKKKETEMDTSLCFCVLISEIFRDFLAVFPGNRHEISCAVCIKKVGKKKTTPDFYIILISS
jgi:hypothetical protein